MKTFLKTTVYTLVALLIAATSFFFWGSANTLPQEEYAKILANAYPAASADSLLTVATYNIGYLSGLTNNQALERNEADFSQHQQWVNQAFSMANAHIIALQEVDFEAHRSFDVEQMVALANHCQMPFAAKAVNWDKRYVPFPYFPPSMHFGKVVSGQAILSKFPITKHERTALERPTNNPFYYDAFYIDRLLQVAWLRMASDTIAVMNVHLEAYDQPTRLAQCQYVKSVFLQLSQSMPVVLVGDFNSEPNHEELRLFLDEPTLASATGQSNQESARTYPSNSPAEQIDHIFFTKKDFDVVDWQIMANAQTASDHLPLLATLRRKALEQ
jgi:endonuclease/exonuclease/phosphatase family metal-dependent hydrolase